jgi:AbiTii
MAKQHSDLLAEIERDVLDESKPVTYALRKCLSLGGRAGSADLREWAARELRGYLGSEDALPDYRRIQTPLLMDESVDGDEQEHRILVNVFDLPEEARDLLTNEVLLTQGIGKIQALIVQADRSGGSLEWGPPDAAELPLIINQERNRVTFASRRARRVYWRMSAADLRGVVDAVRTALTELVAEMRAGMAEGEQAPSPELAEQALRVAVYGNKNRITLTNAMAGQGGTATAKPGGGEQEEPGFWTTSRRIGAAIVGLAAIVTAVAAILTLHPKF